MGLELDYFRGQTPLDEEEKEGLLIPTIATRSELDEFEQQNIEHAIQWSIGSSFNLGTVLTEDFVRKVHRRMFDEVWSWAGEFRKTNKNIGVDRWQIPLALRLLLEDIKYWHENGTYPPDELVLRFKHRLVSIHCFANGNGRHSRLMADILIEKIYKLPVFTWGSATLSNNDNAQSTYLLAVKAADKGDYSLLLAFGRS